ncbi:chymotrypsin-like elastase family member 2A, partial [Brachionus plicatilis]
MRIPIILLATFKHIFACGSGSLKIINGEEASVWPWMVSLQAFGHFCGGSLIASQYVLTAAHCVTSRSFYIKAGTNNLNEANITTYQISRVTIHENYNSRSKENNIALIKLTEEITESSKISTICLPSSTDEKNIINQQVYTAGWGYTNPAGSSSSKILYQTTMQIYENSTICRITPKLHYCAWDPSQKESNVCFGDSGGPLMYSSEGNWYLYGITSFVFANKDRECLNNLSSFFTKVPRYIDWINEKINASQASALNY